jgi:hypothetical protein
VASSFYFQRASDKYIMKNSSFHEILKAKIAEQEVTRTVETPTERFEELLENISPLFHVDIPLRPTFKAYPVSQKTKPVVPEKKEAPMAPPVRSVFKKDLRDEDLSKWNLFEITFSKSLGESVTRPQAMTAFRVFVKKQHPDVNPSADTTNFAVVVKIKDEFLAVIDRKLKGDV